MRACRAPTIARILCWLAIGPNLALLVVSEREAALSVRTRRCALPWGAALGNGLRALCHNLSATVRAIGQVSEDAAACAAGAAYAILPLGVAEADLEQGHRGVAGAAATSSTASPTTAATTAAATTGTEQPKEGRSCSP